MGGTTMGLVNNDRAKCTNSVCRIKEDCVRYKTPSGDRQIFAYFDCNNSKVLSKFIPIDENIRHKYNK